MPRTDPHRPSIVDPTQYEWLRTYPPVMADVTADWLFVCECCGHFPCLWGDYYKYLPTGETILVGWVCAQHKFNYPDRAAAEDAASHRHFQADRERAKNRATVEDRDPAVAAWLDAILAGEAYERFEFVTDMAARFGRGRPLSERQVDALARCLARREQWDAERTERAALEAAEPELTFPSYRIDIEGEILSTRWQDNDFGGGLKMLVKLPGRNKAWGSVPDALQRLSGTHQDTDGRIVDGIKLEGKKIRFRATFEASRDDEHFGFFKRPTNATLEEEETS